MLTPRPERLNTSIRRDEIDVVIPEKPTGFIRDPLQLSETVWVPVFRSAKTGMTILLKND